MELLEQGIYLLTSMDNWHEASNSILNCKLYHWLVSTLTINDEVISVFWICCVFEYTLWTVHEIIHFSYWMLSEFHLADGNFENIQVTLFHFVGRILWLCTLFVPGLHMSIELDWFLSKQLHIGPVSWLFFQFVASSNFWIRQWAHLTFCLVLSSCR